MKTDKELKKEFRGVFGKDPDKYYATDILRSEGFLRKKCSNCSMNFWTVHDDQDVCGDPACQGGFSVVEDNPSKVKLSYADTWLKFKEMFEERGYKGVKRYPVISRWNPTTDFTMASIAAFQPFVISGEVEPPAKKLVIPQFCLRFGDVDNVGVTGAHNTGFIMIGQHQFVKPEDWDQNKAFQDIYDFITKLVGLPKEELTLHEDAWAGGGNYGPCIEFFSRGVELFNQVYMLYEHTEEGDKELDIKVLDMGLGMERVSWFSQGLPNIYEATFPAVLRKLEEATNVEYDVELFKKFSPHAALLNADEVEDLDKAWADVAKKLDMDATDLRQRIMPMTAVYSIAEHSRSLLFAISDGGLPSNVGGGYNLRVILRRALGFIDQFGWDIKLKDVAAWHAEDLKKIFPELHDNLEMVGKILDVETEKYQATKEKAKGIVKRMIDKEVTVEDLLEVYDSNGISPETVRDEAKKAGKTIKIPDNFYKLVAEMHEGKAQATATKKEHKDLDLEGVPDTDALYFKNYKLVEFKGKVLKVVGNKVVLDKTAFYPTSGGQIHDLGTLNGFEVADVYKDGPHIVHEMKDHKLKEGDSAKGSIDWNRRQQLAQHHSGTHILNGAARKVLGDHVFQAGAAKFVDKARLDITHFESLSREDLEAIEKTANEAIEANLTIHKSFMPRNLAEAEHGFLLYQGGAVPGREIRVVDIKGFDTEACGGTHLDLTGEAEKIRILKSSKIQDGIVRIEFVAGDAAKNFENKQDNLLDEMAKLLDVPIDQIPARSEELFLKWKKAKKMLKKKKSPESGELDLSSSEVFKGGQHDIVDVVTQSLKTQREHVLKTLKRFKEELKEYKEKLKEAAQS